MFFPKMSGLGTTKEFQDVFGGYDHNLRSGMSFEEKNITAEHYPLLATRRKRGIIETIANPQGLITKDTIVYVDGADLVYNGERINMNLSTHNAMCPKQLVSMGAYLLIWPDKKWLNTVNMNLFGSMETKNITAAETTVKLCKQDGAAYPSVSMFAPESPADGDLWMDVSDSTPVLKKYSEQSGLWVSIPTTYLKLECANIGANLSAGDGITVSGFTGSLERLNGSYVIESCDTGYIVVIGIIEGTQMTESSEVTIARTIPDMDFVCECGNRIWGCKYGMVNGRTVNEIYASKLGDFKNWNVFQGLSTDSYVASRGSDGQFTGAIAHLGYPLFFKEDCIEKVYPSATGAHQIVTTECRGLQKGCWRSLKIVGDTLYYKSRDGVCAYTGALPVGVYDAFGNVKYSDARAGAVGDIYYISMKDTDGVWHLFTYDTVKRLWHHEDSMQAMFFTEKDGDLYFIDEASNTLMCAYGTEGTEEPAFEWSITSGAIGFEDSEHKYLSRFVFRADLEPNASFRMEMRYDEDAEWVDRGVYCGSGLRSFILPVMPRRCDHVRVRLSGSGGMKLYSVARIKEKGSDIAWR